MSIHCKTLSFMVTLLDLQDLQDCFSWLITSSMFEKLDSSRTQLLSSYIHVCRNELQKRLQVILMEEKEQSNKTNEEVKERNYSMEIENVKCGIDLAKKMNLLLEYGKNKCDYSICYNNDLSMSSAICSFVRTEDCRVFSCLEDICFFVRRSSVSF